MNQPRTTPRNQGLDTLRAAAIVLVLMTHYCGFVSGTATFGFMGGIGWAGVDLFFVLSGYLIGNQVSSTFARGGEFSLREFFGKRLLRTLPNYYVVLAVYFLIPIPGITGTPTASIWRFLSFTQNVGQEYGTTFTHSWSLCIEEQFYLILPLAAIWIARCKKPVSVAWLTIACGISIAILVRAYGFLVHGYNASSAEIYYSSFTRFDELLPGVAIALLKNFHPVLFARILRRGNAVLIAGLIICATVLYCFNDDLHDLFAVTAFGYTLLATGFGLIVCAALSPASVLSRLRVPGASTLALWSYAVYLAHKPVFMAISFQLKRLGIDGAAPILIVPVMLAGVLAGWVLWRLIETPFMQFRARIYPAKYLSKAGILI